jgi:uncharacterized protein YktB (UPF0637 family)
MIEERVAVLEANQKRIEEDITSLFKFMRDHMKKEDKDREEFKQELHEINEKLSNQKSFWAGMLFAFSGIGAIIGSGVAYFK